MDDIIKRLEKEARIISVLDPCNCLSELLINGEECGLCRWKKIMWEAAHEIGEMRSLENARRKD